MNDGMGNNQEASGKRSDPTWSLTKLLSVASMLNTIIPAISIGIMIGLFLTLVGKLSFAFSPRELEKIVDIRIEYVAVALFAAMTATLIVSYLHWLKRFNEQSIIIQLQKGRKSKLNDESLFHYVEIFKNILAEYYRSWKSWMRYGMVLLFTIAYALSCSMLMLLKSRFPCIDALWSLVLFLVILSLVIEIPSLWLFCTIRKIEASAQRKTKRRLKF